MGIVRDLDGLRNLCSGTSSVLENFWFPIFLSQIDFEMMPLLRSSSTLNSRLPLNLRLLQLSKITVSLSSSPRTSNSASFLHFLPPCFKLWIYALASAPMYTPCYKFKLKQILVHLKGNSLLLALQGALRGQDVRVRYTYYIHIRR